MGWYPYIKYRIYIIDHDFGDNNSNKKVSIEIASVTVKRIPEELLLEKHTKIMYPIILSQLEVEMFLFINLFGLAESSLSSLVFFGFSLKFLDQRSEKDLPSNTDGPDKSVLGTAQKTWFKQGMFKRHYL